MRPSCCAEPKRRRLAIDNYKDECGILYWRGKKVVKCRKLPYSVHRHTGRELTAEEMKNNVEDV